jgi:hypothetical protein
VPPIPTDPTNHHCWAPNKGQARPGSSASGKFVSLQVALCRAAEGGSQRCWPTSLVASSIFCPSVPCHAMIIADRIYVLALRQGTEGVCQVNHRQRAQGRWAHTSPLPETHRPHPEVALLEKLQLPPLLVLPLLLVLLLVLLLSANATPVINTLLSSVPAFPALLPLLPSSSSLLFSSSSYHILIPSISLSSITDHLITLFNNYCK